MNHSVSVPQLPGYRMKLSSPSKRVQNLNFMNGYSIQRSPVERLARLSIKSSASAGSLPSVTLEPDRVSAFSHSPLGLSSPPDWLAHDRQVLLFHAYFKEGVMESPDENYRVRKCDLFFYLADGSLHITEPKIPNSGIPQGIFMKRHKVPKEEEGKYYNLDDLYLGANLSMYGRTFHIVDCNASTRAYLSNLGYNVGESEEYPPDKYTIKKKRSMQLETGADESVYRGVRMNDTNAFVEASLGRQIRDGEVIAKYLKDDRKVLRFDCAWDSRDRLYGTILKYTLHYFLADDTIEILEKHTRNSGRDHWPRLLNRNVLHKDPISITTEGNQKSEIYKWNDFRLGSEIQCYGRNIVLLDCDKFTRDFYQSKGVDLGNPLEMNLPERVIPKQAPPPHTGIGSEEDSLGSCNSLLPKPPRKDVSKLLEMDRKVLRFAAVFVDPLPEDKGRKFLINYYLADDTISVAEPPIRNSGITGGKFLNRGKHSKGDGKYLTAKDFQLGETVQILRHRFKLTDADEYTIKFISNHPETYPSFNISNIIIKLTTKLKKEKFTLGKAFRLVDTNHSGYISFSELKNLLSEYFNNKEVPPMEVLTIMRFFDSEGTGLISINEFVKKLMETDVITSSQEIGGGAAALKIPVVEDTYLETCQYADSIDVGLHLHERILFAFASYLKNRGIGLQKIFNYFDKDGSGVLERDEWRKILVNSDFIPGSMTKDQVEILTNYFVGDNTVLDLKEFRSKLWQVFNDFEAKEMSRRMHRNAGDTSF